MATVWLDYQTPVIGFSVPSRGKKPDNYNEKTHILCDGLWYIILGTMGSKALELPRSRAKDFLKYLPGAYVVED